MHPVQNFNSSAMRTLSHEGDDRRIAEADLFGYLLQAVRREHPEWVRPDGACPECRDYERKIAAVIGSVSAGAAAPY